MENELVVSLLWPSEATKKQYIESKQLADRGVVDLGIDQIVRSVCFDLSFFEQTKKLILNLCNDPEVIQYRLDIVEDFLNIPQLGSQFENILPTIQKLESQNKAKYVAGADQFRKIAWKLDVLLLYIECVAGIHSILSGCKEDLKSEGLLRLYAFIDDVIRSDSYRSMAEELPGFRQKLQSMSSVTIGINLDNELRAVEAVFLSIEPKPFKEKKRSLISSLFGLNSSEDEYKGVSQYQSIVKNDTSAFEGALFRSFEEIFKAAILPIGAAIQRYIQVHTQQIILLEFELGFYMGASRFIRKLKTAGISMCKPAIAPAEQRICQIEQMIDVILPIQLTNDLTKLHLDTAIITNDVEFGAVGRLFILTGPNQGGKTTYTRATGLAQVLFQTGLYVPGSTALMSPVDWIYTHFSEEEKPNIKNGRLGEESQRLSQIFKHATGSSVILLNESLSSTSTVDSLHLARDIVKGIRVIGCRAVFATHLLELAAVVEDINAELPGDSKLVSMVAGVEREQNGSSGNKRTYKVTPGQPNEMSFAKDIAHLHGISFEQIMETLKKRNMIE